MMTVSSRLLLCLEEPPRCLQSQGGGWTYSLLSLVFVMLVRCPVHCEVALKRSVDSAIQYLPLKRLLYQHSTFP